MWRARAKHPRSWRVGLAWPSSPLQPPRAPRPSRVLQPQVRRSLRCRRRGELRRRGGLLLQTCRRVAAAAGTAAARGLPTLQAVCLASVPTSSPRCSRSPAGTAALAAEPGAAALAVPQPLLTARRCRHCRAVRRRRRPRRTQPPPRRPRAHGRCRRCCCRGPAANVAARAEPSAMGAPASPRCHRQAPGPPPPLLQPRVRPPRRPRLHQQQRWQQPSCRPARPQESRPPRRRTATRPRQRPAPRAPEGRAALAPDQRGRHLHKQRQHRSSDPQRRPRVTPPPPYRSGCEAKSARSGSGPGPCGAAPDPSQGWSWTSGTNARWPRARRCARPR